MTKPTKPTKPRARILAIVDDAGVVVDVRSVNAAKFATTAEFYTELIRVRKQLLKKFSEPEYHLIEGAAESFGDLLWSYPELREAVS
jgi:hypothetical protein